MSAAVILRPSDVLGAKRRWAPLAEALGPVLPVDLQAPGWAAGPEEVRAAKVVNDNNDDDNETMAAVLLCVNELVWVSLGAGPLPPHYSPAGTLTAPV